MPCHEPPPAEELDSTSIQVRMGEAQQQYTVTFGHGHTLLFFFFFLVYQNFHATIWKFDAFNKNQATPCL